MLRNQLKSNTDYTTTLDEDEFIWITINGVSLRISQGCNGGIYVEAFAKGLEDNNDAVNTLTIDNDDIARAITMH